MSTYFQLDDNVSHKAQDRGASCNFWLFLCLKSVLGGSRFDTNETVVCWWSSLHAYIFTAVFCTSHTHFHWNLVQTECSNKQVFFWCTDKILFVFVTRICAWHSADCHSDRSHRATLHIFARIQTTQQSLLWLVWTWHHNQLFITSIICTKKVEWAQSWKADQEFREQREWRWWRTLLVDNVWMMFHCLVYALHILLVTSRCIMWNDLCYSYIHDHFIPHLLTA